MRVLAIIPMHTSTRHLEEDTRGFCFLFCSERCLALIPLPLPFSPLPFGMDFGSATRAGGSLSPPGGEAFGGTALTAGAPATLRFPLNPSNLWESSWDSSKIVQLTWHWHPLFLLQGTLAIVTTRNQSHEEARGTDVSSTGRFWNKFSFSPHGIC